MKDLIRNNSFVRNFANLLRGSSGVNFDSGKRATPLLNIQEYSFDPIIHSSKEKSAHPRVIYISSPTQRSGTNFICNALNLHAEIIFPEADQLPKEHFLYSHADVLSNYFSKTLGYWPKWVKDKQSLVAIHGEMMSQVGSGMLRVISNNIKNSTKTLLLRTPDAGNIEYFPSLFPNGKLLIVIRDGRDTVDSFVKSFSGSWAFKKMARRWSSRIEYLYDVYDNMQTAGKRDQIEIIRYENLNRNPADTMKGILSFLGLAEKEYDWEQLEELPVMGSSTQFNRSSGNEFWQSEAKTDPSSFSEKWVSWSSSKKHTFKKIAGSQLIRAGYEKDLSW